MWNCKSKYIQGRQCELVVYTIRVVLSSTLFITSSCKTCYLFVFVLLAIILMAYNIVSNILTKINIYIGVKEVDEMKVLLFI